MATIGIRLMGANRRSSAIPTSGLLSDFVLVLKIGPKET